MTLDRKDVRAKLAPDLHAAFVLLAKHDNVEIGDFIEKLIRQEVVRRIHDAQAISEGIDGLGISGRVREWGRIPK